MAKADYNNQKRPTKYWFVDITLTSGEVLHFYVKALTIKDAYEKAEDYTYWVSNDVLRSKLMKFKLMP